MNAIASKPDSYEGLIPALFMSILSAALALPSLWDAWQHDLYSTGGLTAFLIWLTTLGAVSFRQRQTAGPHSFTWIAISGLLCMAGSITSLHVCHHLALVAAFCGLTMKVSRGWIAAVGALAWLPACGWLASRLSSGGLAGWERPMLAAIALFPLLKRSPNHTAS